MSELKTGQHVRIEVVKVPRARRRKIGLSFVFRHDPAVKAEWSVNLGESRKRLGMKIPRRHPIRRRVRDRQRYVLTPGTACEFACLNSQQMADLRALGDCIKVTIVKAAPATPKTYSFGF